MKPERTDDFGGGIILQYVSAAVFMLAGTIFFIFLTKSLPTEQVGNISLLLAIVQLFSIVFSLGIKGAMEHFISFYSGRNNYGMVRNLIRSFLIISGMLALVAALIIYAMSGGISVLFYHTRGHYAIIQLLGIDIGLVMLFTVLTGITSGLQHFKTGARIYMSGAIAVYGLAIVMLYFTGNIYLMVGGWIAGYVFGIALYYIHIRGYLNTIPRSRESFPVRNVLRYSVPLLFSSLLFFGSTYVDRLIVAVFLNLSLLGIYNLALLVSQGIAFFINPLNNLLLPKFSQMHARDNREAIREGVRISSNILNLVYSPIVLGVASLAPSIMFVFGNSNYIPGSIPLVILVIISGLFVSQYVLIQALSGIRKTRIFLMATTASFIANVLFSFTLIPRYNLVGAAVSNSIAPVASFSVIMFFSLREKIASFDIPTMMKIWGSAMLMAIIVSVFQYMMGYSIFTLVTGIVIGAVTYLICVKFTRTLRQSDAEFLAGIFHRNAGPIKKVIKFLSS